MRFGQSPLNPTATINPTYTNSGQLQTDQRLTVWSNKTGPGSGQNQGSGQQQSGSGSGGSGGTDQWMQGGGGGGSGGGTTPGGGCPPCTTIPWWVLPIATWGLVQTIAMIADTK